MCRGRVLGKRRRTQEWRGATIADAAAHVHRDFAEHLKYARLFRKSHEHDGLMVERTHAVEDEDVLEFHTA